MLPYTPSRTLLIYEVRTATATRTRRAVRVALATVRADAQQCSAH